MQIDDQLSQIYSQVHEQNISRITDGLPVQINDKFVALTKQDQMKQINKLFDQILEETSCLDSTRQNYIGLEKQVQKYEGEIRQHIRMEQQIKLYAESLQQKCDDSEATRSEMLETTKVMINNVKRENQNSTEQIRMLRAENDQLRTQIKNHQDRNGTDKDRQVYFLQERIKVLEGTGGQEPKFIKVQRQSSQNRVSGDFMGRIQSESSASQTIDNSALCSSNKKNDYFKVKIEIENKQLQRKKTNSSHYHTSDRPQTIAFGREQKSLSVNQPPPPQKYNNARQYSSGATNKPFMSNPASMGNSIQLVSNFQKLVKSRQVEQKFDIGNWNAKKIIGAKIRNNNTISHKETRGQDYSEFLDHDIHNF